MAAMRRRTARSERSAGERRQVVGRHGRDWRTLAQVVLALLVVLSMIGFYALALR